MGLNPLTGVLKIREAPVLRKDHVRTQQEEAMCKSMAEASEGTKPVNVLILDFMPPDEINFRCLSHLVCGILLWQP